MSTLYFHMAGATYAELFEVWAMAESEMAERAARNPDGEARAAAMAPYLADTPPGADEEELERFVEQHTGFHAAMAALAGNRVLELTMQTFGQIVSHHRARSGRCSPRTTTRWPARSPPVTRSRPAS